MSKKPLPWIRQITGLTATQKLILWILDADSNWEGIIWKSTRGIAEEITEEMESAKDIANALRNVQRHLAALEEKGFLEGRGTDGQMRLFGINHEITSPIKRKGATDE